MWHASKIALIALAVILPIKAYSDESNNSKNATPIEDVKLKLSNWPDLVSVDLTQDSGVVWDNIRQGFAIPDLHSSKVSLQQKAMLKHRHSLQVMLKNSEPYIYYIAEQCEKRGLPTELALIPFVESKFNPHAHSRRAASGLWQFIPSTGRHFDLKQNDWVDERRDLVASTRAALDYFTYLYDMYGDWHLALISYNWGEGSVAKAIQKAKNAGLEPTLQNLDLPRETANYVPKLQAIKNIINTPKKFRVDLPKVPNQPYFVEIKRKTDLDLREVARLSGVNLEDFKALNAGLKQPVLYAAQTNTLLVPVSDAPVVKASLKQYKPPKPYKRYRVRRGDTLSTIAHKLNVSTHNLMVLNGLHKRSIIKPGMALTIPNVQRVRDWNRSS